MKFSGDGAMKYQSVFSLGYGCFDSLVKRVHTR